MRTFRIFLTGIVVMCSIFTITGELLAAEKKFPTKPIQVIIPFQPGDTDNLLRPFVEKMHEYLGQPLNLVYKPGAAGSVGAGFVAAAKPDGYTLVGSSQSSIVIVPLTHKEVGYTWESFAPVSCLVDVAALLAVQSTAPWKDLKELVEEARKSPGNITYSSSGTYGITHLIVEAFSREAGINFNYIPSQGSGPTVTAVLGGHVHAASTALAPALPHIKAGTLRPIAVYSSKRMKALPNVPTLLELGYSISAPGIYGLLAPKETPKEVIETIHLAAKRVVEDHRAFIIERLDRLGAQIGFAGPEEYKSWLKNQHNIFDKVLKDLKK